MPAMCSTIFSWSTCLLCRRLHSCSGKAGMYSGGKCDGKQFHWYSIHDVSFRKHIPQCLRWTWTAWSNINAILTEAFQAILSRTDIFFSFATCCIFFFSSLFLSLLFYNNWIPPRPGQYPIKLCNLWMVYNPMGEPYWMDDNRKL